MPKKIKPTDIESTKIEPTEIKPTKIEPTKIESTKIEPTKIEPTKIEPTDIRPTEIKPTEIKSLGNTTSVGGEELKKPKFGYSKGNSIAYFIAACLASFVTLLLGVTTGLTIYTILDIAITAFAFIMFFAELKKMQITQADLDAWKQEILAKHPNYNKQYLDAMTVETYKNGLNKFAYWTHTFKVSFNKVLACILLPTAVLSAVMGVALPAIGVGGSSSVSIVGNTYISEASSSVVVVTAYKFETSSTYKIGYYDKEDHKYTWTGSYNYTQSGSKVTVKGGYFTIKNGGKKLMGSDGSYFIRV